MTFDPAAATKAMIDALGPEALAKAAAYTAGNHWMLLGGLLVSAAVTWVIVRFGLLDRWHGKLGRLGERMRVFLTCAVFFLLSAILSLPWGTYEEWGRERSYGRTDQPLGDFLVQDAVGIGLSALFGGLFFLGVYALIRRTGRRWWLWSGGLAALAGLSVLLLSPILIEPLFNDYKPVPAGKVRDAVVAMAAEADIPADRIFIYDGSRQSNNFTANVSGISSSARIAISDVALTTASLDEVKAVTGHEIGHYVLGHVWRWALLLPVLAMVFFFLADRLYAPAARLFGSSAALGDARGLPVLMFVVGVLATLATPVTNAFTRIGEREADAYSLRTVNLPDALASALIKTAEYRYPRPHPAQEVLFYTHPSVERRVRSAMDWKSAHPAQP
ncbi:MAG: M48 family metallopeptidase [Sphingopyxis sp.]|nr:M48 family metallopeptidase [Sphingopyxis sp.]